MGYKNFHFEGAFGDKLAARIDYPDNKEPRSYILFAHCFTGSKDILATTRIAKALWLRGFAVCRFDFTGLGESEGDFSGSTFTSNIKDITLAAKYMRENFLAPTVLIGHSLGGAAVLAAAHELSDVRAVCTIGAPSDPKHVTHLFENAKDEIVQKGEAEINVGGRSFRLRKSFLEDLIWHKQEKLIRNLKKGLLIFHSPIDSVVGIENAANIYTAAKHPKSFISLAGADHMLSNKADTYYVAEVISAWVHRYGFCKP